MVQGKCIAAKRGDGVCSRAVHQPVGRMSKALTSVRFWCGLRTQLGHRFVSVQCKNRKWSGLFYHLVGFGEQRGGHAQTECFRGLEIDSKLELGRLLHGKISRFIAFLPLGERRWTRAVAFRRVGRNNEPATTFCGDAIKPSIWQPNVLRCSPIMMDLSRCLDVFILL
jgi:hypothetical protein